MKRLFIILTIMISSFFFYSCNVNAVTHSINESDFELINSDFMTVRDYAINYSTENSCHYIIYYEDSLYNIYFYKFSTTPSDSYAANSYLGFKLYPSSSNPAIQVQYDNGEFNTITTRTSYFMYKIVLSSTSIDYSTLLDTNYTNFFSSVSITLTYDDKSYLVDSSNSILGLYEIYVDNFGEYKEIDIHLEEKETLSNFYILVIDKINILVTSIVSNYIYLSVIGVFILIFIIELIFRRYL